jgi:hypothetical protein
MYGVNIFLRFIKSRGNLESLVFFMLICGYENNDFITI